MLKAIIDNGEKSDGYNHIESIFMLMEIGDVFKLFYRTNKAKDNPYHNNTHIFCVVDLIWQFCRSKGYDQNKPKLTRALLIAALYHDFNHSGGKTDDSCNIKEALNGITAVKVMNAHYEYSYRHRRMSLFHWQLVKKLIQKTEYPYKKVHFGLLRLLREADILSYEHEEWQKYVYEGLCTELGKNPEENIKVQMENLLNFHEMLVKNEVKTPFFKDILLKHYESFMNSVQTAKMTS